MDIDPVKIFMFVISTIMVIMAAVILAYMFNLFSAEVKVNELDRFSVELAENIMHSELTASKYVFDRDKLDAYKQTDNANDEKDLSELGFLRACGFAYHAEIEDIITKEKWEFGYKPSPYLSNNMIDSKERTFISGIDAPDALKPSEFYGTMKPAKLSLAAYDTWFVRATCAIEKAHVLKETISYRMPKCVRYAQTGYAQDASPSPCFSIERDGDFACYKMRSASSTRTIECRKLAYAFEPLYQDSRDGEKIMRFYPIKQSASATCTSLRTDKTPVAGRTDTVSIVRICMEDAK